MSKQARFENHYSRMAARYAEARPRYPAPLFQYLASLPLQPHRALDCGTGNGQAAAGLAQHFQQVLACDPSSNQVRHGTRRHNLHYLVAQAEERIVTEGSMDLVVAAQAAHWFDLDRFYQMVREVAAHGGIVAVWCYTLDNISIEVDPIIRRFGVDVVGRYWPPGRQHVDGCYRTLPFPFSELQAPTFPMVASWTLSELTAYVSTWSAVSRYRNLNATDPMADLTRELSAAWGDSRMRRNVTWMLHMRVGRVR